MGHEFATPATAAAGLPVHETGVESRPGVAAHTGPHRSGGVRPTDAWCRIANGAPPSKRRLATCARCKSQAPCAAWAHRPPDVIQLWADHAILPHPVLKKGFNRSTIHQPCPGGL